MPTLRPTDGATGCVVETGIFSYTYDGSTSTGACFQKGGTCLSWWYWGTPVNVTKFNIRSHYYYPNSSIYLIWGRVNGSWVELWTGEWMPAHAAWDSKVISCNNCDGILIGQRHVSQPSRPCITEVTVDYEPVGKATIVSISKPSTFTPNVQFRIRPTIRNDGGDDTLFVTLTNTDTGVVLEYLEIYVSAGRNWVPSMYVTLTQTTNFDGLLEAGHIVNGSKAVDDTEKFTVPVVSPTISFSAYPTTIVRGQSSKLTWSTNYATSVTINGVSKSLSGSEYVYPTVTTTYTLVATGEGGSTSKSVTVTVTEPTVCIGGIWEGQSAFYTGPFPPETNQLLATVCMQNTGNQDGCLIYAKFVEYPGEPNEAQLGDVWSRIINAGGITYIDFYWDTPSGVTSWLLGVKVWADDETEPSWGAMGTKIFKILRS